MKFPHQRENAKFFPRNEDTIGKVCGEYGYCPLCFMIKFTISIIQKTNEACHDMKLVSKTSTISVTSQRLRTAINESAYHLVT